MLNRAANFKTTTYLILGGLLVIMIWYFSLHALNSDNYLTKDELASQKQEYKDGNSENGYMDRQKEDLRQMLIVTIVALLALFMLVLLLTLIRQSRSFHDRIGIGKRHAPTEHIDAWSQYNLSDQELKDVQDDS